MTRYASDFGAFEISPIPGQPQMAHCHGFFVVPEGRGKGIGTQQKLAQMKVIDDELFDFATCTVDAGNAAQKRVLEKTGWHRLFVFANRRTGGLTELWGWAVNGDHHAETVGDAWPHGATVKLRYIGWQCDPNSKEFGWAKRDENGRLVTTYGGSPLDAQSWAIVEERPVQQAGPGGVA